jgi:hypothetical protein
LFLAPGPYIDYFRRIANHGSHLPATFKKCRLELPLGVQSAAEAGELMLLFKRTTKPLYVPFVRLQNRLRYSNDKRLDHRQNSDICGFCFLSNTLALLLSVLGNLDDKVACNPGKTT